MAVIEGPLLLGPKMAAKFPHLAKTSKGGGKTNNLSPGGVILYEAITGKTVSNTGVDDSVIAGRNYHTHSSSASSATAATGERRESEPHHTAAESSTQTAATAFEQAGL